MDPVTWPSWLLSLNWSKLLFSSVTLNSNLYFLFFSIHDNNTAWNETGMKIIKVLNNPPCIFPLFYTIRKTNRPKKGTIKKTTSTINAISMFPEFTFTFISFSIHLSILPTPYELRPYEPSSWCTQYAPCFSRVNQERQRSKKKIRTSKSALYCAR